MINDKCIVVKKDEVVPAAELAKKALKLYVLKGYSIFDKKIIMNAKAYSLDVLKSQNVINLSSPDKHIWDLHAIYVAHPRRANAFLRVEDYKDYILREMVSDIANYIIDHLSPQKITIGIISNKKLDAEAPIPVENVVVDAKLHCNISSNYCIDFENSTAKSTPSEYVWIDKFPDVKSAVEHQVEKMEVIKETSVNLNAEAASGGLLAKFKANSDIKFYIYYKK